jgi:DUF1680 family protein
MKSMSKRNHGTRYVAWVACGFLGVCLAFLACAQPNPDKVSSAVPLQVLPFAPKAVRLLDGPFKHALEANAKYLLSLEPDRLLSGFRTEAGLKPAAAKYGGWESQGIAGHTLGHYLSACSWMYQDTGNRQFLDRVNDIVDQLAECQKANGDGYVAAIPNGKKIFAEIARGDIRTQDFDLNGVWVPWYTMHKVFAGLIDARRFCDNTKALDVATCLADWAAATTRNLTEAQWQKMLVCEQGGMNESLADLYALTGNTNYLNLAGKFYHQAVMDPLARGDDILDGLHSNMQIPKTIGAARLYELIGKEQYRNIATFFWERVALHRSYAIGGHGDAERFFPVKDFARHLTAATCETCCTYNLLKLSQHLFAWSPNAVTMDFYERALYNDSLASQDPETGMFVYLMSLKPGGFKTYSTPLDSFWCCVGSGMENHARYGEAIYSHDNQSLCVNLFIPSELTWREKRLVLRQETRFPESDSVKLLFACDQPVQLALRIRWPAWAQAPLTVRLNGRNQDIDGQPGSYFTLNREWRNGDRVEIRLPMTLRTELLPGATNLVALLYGPIVLAGELGTNAMPPSTQAKDQTRFLHWPTPPAPVFVATPDSLLKQIKTTDRPLTFRTRGVGRPEDVTLVPLFKIRAQRYAVYWNLLTESGWKAYETARQAEVQRQKDLEARTVDKVQPGEHQSERDHHVQGEKSDPVEALGRPLRHAYDGGWFSYELAVPTNATADLIVTYWGGETGSRTFDILVEGRNIATQNLHQDDPGQFWDKDYPLPAELTKNKTAVTVKFQAQPGNYAGGVFGLRVAKRDGLPHASQP